MTAHLHTVPNARRGFTLVELMVVIVIMSILSSLIIGGIIGTRQRAKIDKTKTTIRKIQEVVLPQYESYLTRRLPVSIYTSSTNAAQRARDRLQAVRSLMVFEMPDSWADVALSGTSNLLISGSSIPSYAWNGATRSYGAFRSTLTASSTASITTSFGEAECLYMIIARSGFQPDTMEHFRSDEIADVDGDKAPEFVDSWSRPIRFIRWAPGFSSAVQPNDSNAPPDPFDSFAVSGPPRDFALVPLIYSSGPDGALAQTGTDGYGLTGPPAGGWSNLSMLSITSPAGVNPLPGAVTSGSDEAAADNITNHDLMGR